MTNFFEQELRKLFADGGIIDDPKFVGRACLGSLDGDLRVRAEFITMGIAEHYSALRLTVLNRKEGVVDKSVLRFEDIIGIKAIPDSPIFRNGLSPYIWDDRGKTDWYVYRPTPADFEALRQAADDYLDVFRERVSERVMAPPARKSPARKISKNSRDER